MQKRGGGALSPPPSLWRKRHKATRHHLARAPVAFNLQLSTLNLFRSALSHRPSHLCAAHLSGAIPVTRSLPALRKENTTTMRKHFPLLGLASFSAAILFVV